MSEKFIKYKYITAAGGNENGRNRSYRYFNYICGRPYPYCRAGNDTDCAIKERWRELPTRFPR